MANSAPVFSKQETAWHRNARFSFVPWVARLLGDGPLRGNSNPLPPGNPDGLTDETVDAIREITNRAVWQFLARDCGWRECWAVMGPASDGGFSKRRLWDSGSGDELPPLKFTSAGVDLLIGVYNATRGDGAIEGVNVSGCGDANGDLFLEHLVFRRLSESAQALGVQTDFGWGQWYANPLNALLHATSFGDPESAAPNWDRLAEPDIAPFLPWIGSRFAGVWRARRDQVWQSHESAARWYGGLSSVSGELGESHSDRPDLLIFLLEALAGQADSAQRDRERFEGLTKSLDRRERERIAIPWADFLKVAEDLRSIQRACVSLHPIERSGPEKCFLAAWEEMTFAETADSLKRLRQQIRPVIS